MVKLRLQRYGKNKAPFYRVVATDSHNPRDGRFIEIIGTYHPTSKIEGDQLKIDEEKAIKWIKDGAQLSDTVRALFSKAGIIAKVSKKGE